MSVAVVHDTKGAGIEALAQKVGRLGRHRVLVGVPGSARDSASGVPMATVAAWTEFGTGTAPERPFLRGGIRAAMPRLKVLNERLLRAVIAGEMADLSALEVLGLAASGEVKKYMTGPHFVPNAPSTIVKKGSSQPTIDSGSLRQAVTHTVEAT